MSSVSLLPAEGAAAYSEVAELASIIWNEHYAGLLTQGQIDYMLDKFQTPRALQKYAGDGYEFYLIKIDGDSAGYVGLKLNEPAGKLFLSKLYILKQNRGAGYSKQVLALIAQMAKDAGQSAIWLTVNKNNVSYEIYKRLGFKTVKEAVTDIGGGYVMDDYIMEKEIK